MTANREESKVLLGSRIINLQIEFSYKYKTYNPRNVTPNGSLSLEAPVRMPKITPRSQNMGISARFVMVDVPNGAQ